VDGDLLRSQAYRQEADVLRELDDWRNQFTAKGCTPLDHR
jgi:hypothetical protein